MSKALDTLAAQIGSSDYKNFELGLESLGEILGFESVRPNATADPDCAWREGEETWLLWEAKTMEHPEAPLAARDARQAGTHHNWVARQLGWPEPARSATIVVCPRGQVHPDAVAVADQRLFLIGPEPVREIAGRAAQAIRVAANEAPALDREDLVGRIGQLFIEQRLGTDELLEQLTAAPISTEGSKVPRSSEG